MQGIAYDDESCAFEKNCWCRYLADSQCWKINWEVQLPMNLGRTWEGCGTICYIVIILIYGYCPLLSHQSMWHNCHLHINCKKTTWYFCISFLDSFIYFSSYPKHVCIPQTADIDWFGGKVQTWDKRNWPITCGMHPHIMCILTWQFLHPDSTKLYVWKYFIDIS